MKLSEKAINISRNLCFFDELRNSFFNVVLIRI